MRKELIGKEIDRPYQGLYKIKDFVHGHYYIQRETDSFQDFVKEEDFEKEYDEYMLLLERKATKFPCEEFFEEKGWVMHVDSNSTAHKIELHTHAVPMLLGPDSAGVWHKSLSIFKFDRKYINDMNTVEIEVECSYGYGMFHTFLKGEGKDEWNIQAYPLVYNQTNVTPEIFKAEVEKARKKLYKILFSTLDEKKLFIHGNRFGDDKTCLEVITYFDQSMKDGFCLYGGNVVNNRYRGINGTYAKPKGKPATKKDVIELVDKEMIRLIDIYLTKKSADLTERGQMVYLSL